MGRGPRFRESMEDNFLNEQQFKALRAETIDRLYYREDMTEDEKEAAFIRSIKYTNLSKAMEALRMINAHLDCVRINVLFPDGGEPEALAVRRDIRLRLHALRLEFDALEDRLGSLWIKLFDLEPLDGPQDAKTPPRDAEA